MDSESLKRRAFVSMVSFSLLSGCTANDPPDGSSPTPTPATESQTPTKQPAHPREVLPVPPDGWAKIDGGPAPVGDLGDDIEGYQGTYTSPDGVEYTVIVILWPPDRDTETLGVQWKDIGWAVFVADGRYTFAASSGTSTETMTPGHAPQLGQTPVENDEDPAITLLAGSPELTEEYVRKNRYGADG